MSLEQCLSRWRGHTERPITPTEYRSWNEQVRHFLFSDRSWNIGVNVAGILGGAQGWTQKAWLGDSSWVW